MQSNLIVSVTMVNLSYSQKLLWKYCNYFHPSQNKVIHPVTNQDIVMATFDFVGILLVSYNLKEVTFLIIQQFDRYYEFEVKNY